MRISVVTPSYNQAQFLKATMESIHSQGYPDLEHIVMDGGSTDGSVEIIEEYADRLAYWVSEPDGGQTDALIKGFERATGDIFCWLNSDDLFEPGTLAEVRAVFEAENPPEFVFGDSMWIDAAGRALKAKREHRFNRFVWLNDHNYIPQPSTFWTSSLYHRSGGLDRDFNLAMDADLWIRFAELTTPLHVKRPWSRMRFYPEQKMSAMKGASFEEVATIRDRYIDDSEVGRTAKRIAARGMRVVLKAAAGGYSAGEAWTGAKAVVGGQTWEQTELARAERSRDR